MKTIHPHKLDNFNKALASLEKAASLPIKEERDIAGIIKNFEFVYELSWNVLKNSLLNLGYEEPVSPRDAFQKAFQAKLIQNEKIWPAMIKDRNLTVHTYDQSFAKQMMKRIIEDYLPEFQRLSKKLIEQFKSN